VFLYQLSAADAAPTDSTDLVDSVCGAVAFAAGVAGCAAAGLGTRGTKRPRGTQPTPSCRGRGTPLSSLDASAHLNQRWSAGGTAPATPAQAKAADALAAFAGAWGPPAPPACADRPLSEREATAAASALTLSVAGSQAVLDALVAFDQQRSALFGADLELSHGAGFFYHEGSGGLFAMPGEVTESPSRSVPSFKLSCVLSAPPLSCV
jgi:hypothetical protein